MHLNKRPPAVFESMLFSPLIYPIRTWERLPEHEYEARFSGVGIKEKSENGWKKRLPRNLIRDNLSFS
jgi:hypothetical protein